MPKGLSPQEVQGCLGGVYEKERLGVERQPWWAKRSHRNISGGMFAFTSSISHYWFSQQKPQGNRKGLHLD